MNLTQAQKDFLDQILANSNTSGEILDKILGDDEGGSGPGLPDTVDPPGNRGYVVNCVEYMLSKPGLLQDQINIINGLL